MASGQFRPTTPGQEAAMRNIRNTALAAFAAVTLFAAACGAPDPTPPGTGGNMVVDQQQTPDPEKVAAEKLAEYAKKIATSIDGQYSHRGVTSIVKVEIVDKTIKVSITKFGYYKLDEIVVDGTRGSMSMDLSAKVEKITVDYPVSATLERVPGF